MKEAVQGVDVTVEQPLAHLISHMLSGVQAQVAIKIYGDNLDVLRAQAKAMKEGATRDQVQVINGTYAI